MADLEALSTAAPQLAVLTFEDCDLSIIGPADPVAHLPESLHTLHIRHDTFPAEVILSRIDAPGLECLEIDVAVAYVGHPQGRIYPPRTFPSVHRLIIHMAQSSTSLGTYDGYHFSLTPRATSFHIVDIYGRCDHIVRCLASHPAYLPDLRSLTVDVEFVSRVGVLREPLTVLLSSRRDTLEMVNLSPNLFGDLGEGLLEELGGGPVQVSCT
ncbi:hypothetical protein PsYK624_025890 [Phanerochaete sordida]|uniref:Uncharacterized protein n=1 Tax=Phanerochaete sordida TaxID=48140 RepID=A0A9P3G2L1_9APHY|nr:hypothetical protein PsYK624_025890 [Phanerochaete sordida]